MIKVEPCKGCGGVLLVDRFMGVTVRCEATPLDAQAAGRTLLAGQTLYWVRYSSGRPSSFGSATPTVLGALRREPSERPVVVGQHRCAKNASTAPVSVSQDGGEAGAPKAPRRPPVAPSRPFSGHSTATPTAPTAETPASETPADASPRCSGCGHPCADGTYASIELGDILVWVHHTEHCGG